MHSSKFMLFVVAQMIYINQASYLPPKLSNNNEMPDECENMNFCFKLDPNNYPQQEIDANMQIFDIEVVDDNQTEERINGDDGTTPQLCHSDDKVGLIHYIRDRNDNIRYVVQSKNFKQKFHVVQCSEPGRLENSSLITPVTDLCKYKVSCKHQLVPVQFLVLSGDLNKMELATIKDGLPMACSCEYSFPGDECDIPLEPDQVA